MVDEEEDEEDEDRPDAIEEGIDEGWKDRILAMQWWMRREGRIRKRNRRRMQGRDRDKDKDGREGRIRKRNRRWKRRGRIGYWHCKGRDGRMR